MTLAWTTASTTSTGCSSAWLLVWAAAPAAFYLRMQLQDKPGALENALKMFWKRDVNMSRIDSRPSKGMSLNYDFTVDVEDMKVEDEKCQELLKDLEKECQSVQVMSPQTVPWFPMKASDLDSFSNLTLDAGSELESDHPGFNDEEYRRRRSNVRCPETRERCA